MENKVRCNLWLRPLTIQKMDRLIKITGCKSRSQFIEQAAEFYLAYRSSDIPSPLLSNTLTDTLEGMVEDSNNRMRCLLFKMCAGLDMALHMIAAHCGDVGLDRGELREHAVDEVDHVSGQIDFDEAIGDVRWIYGGVG